ncbi:MAG TPA: hypothetical protein PLF40_09420, partial [Kofleriaceae bacterium]|nr:hypothetical protein [Kofleriaceae bacterium]
ASLNEAMPYPPDTVAGGGFHRFASLEQLARCGIVRATFGDRYEIHSNDDVGNDSFGGSARARR